jgi:Rad3-related DNA helicase
MKDPIGLHDEYALVPPQTFVDRFELRWTKEFNMPASEPLKSLWGTMAKTYQRAIRATATGENPRWLILQPPTGSGKTMGAVVYAALQAERNLAEADTRKPVGIMIVTRLKAQADDLVADINATAQRAVALADHTDHRATPEQLHDSDIVVITHQAYVKATQTLSDTKAGRWDKLTTWRGGKRSASRTTRRPHTGFL